MNSLDAIEQRHGLLLPTAYRVLAARRAFDPSSPRHLQVHKAEWIPPDEILTFEWIRPPEDGLVAFACSGGGDVWAWHSGRQTPGGEYAITYCPHDEDAGLWYAPNFLGWLYRTGLDYATELYDEQSVARQRLGGWAAVLDEFGAAEHAADIRVVVQASLINRKYGRQSLPALLLPEAVSERVAARFGLDYIDAEFWWAKEDSGAG